MNLKFYRSGYRLMAEVHNPADPNNVTHVEVERDTAAGPVLNLRAYRQWDTQIDAFKASEPPRPPPVFTVEQIAREYEGTPMLETVYAAPAPAVKRRTWLDWLWRKNV